ncbi:hypothetical protein [Janibacter melonis]|uniref:hypothetical protein n=1 Tax=Janibacter melonis TaxID=262209 RepID=UPI0027DA7A25|nr:hypothetical protein [Janibacter melonis]
MLTAFAEAHTIPVENVCAPDPLRRVVWTPPEQTDAAGFEAALAARRAALAARSSRRCWRQPSRSTG